MNIYAESSAVLAWLLAEDPSRPVGEVLDGAALVVASDLTVLECERILVRALALGELDEGATADRRAQLSMAAAHWHRLRITSDIVDRAARPFPSEPIRTLDAIHLASALTARTSVPGLELLSLDRRIRRAGRLLGFRLQPD